MNIGRYILTLGVVLLALACTTAIAQPPRQMSYQGVLYNQSTVLNGTHTLVLKLYTASGTEIFSETHSVNVANGIFNVNIGSVTPIPASVNFSEPYFLGISIDGSAEITPRTLMAASPYALNATTVNGAAGDVTLVGSGGTTITRTGNTVTIGSSGGSGSGVQSLASPDGSITVTNPSGPAAGLSLANGSVTGAKISTTGAANGSVLTFNGTSVVWGPASGLTLPYSGTANSSADAFAVTNNGTGRAGSFRNTNGSATGSAVYGESSTGTPFALVAGVEGKSATGFGVLGRGGNGSTSVYGMISQSAGPGKYVTGTGVSGFSEVGHGLGGITDHGSSAGVYGMATGSGYGVRATSAGGNAGLFEITSGTNANHAIVGNTSGTGAGVFGTNVSSLGSTAGVLGEVLSTSNGTSWADGAAGVFGRVTAIAPGAYSAGVRGVNLGSGLNGSGVAGYQAGSGAGVYGETPGGAGLYGVSTGAGFGVRGSSVDGTAGAFEITNTANPSTALSGTSAGSGPGITGANTSATGITAGVYGTVVSTTNGTGANSGPAGILGRVATGAAGAFSAGVRGINMSSSANGSGVIGFHAGSGSGVYGESSDGMGVYGAATSATSTNGTGVVGETFSPNGAGVEARYSGTGVGRALTINNGAIYVIGANKAAFVHLVTAANKTNNFSTELNNPLCNGDPNAIIIITRRKDVATGVVNTSPLGVIYQPARSRWEIYNENSSAMAVNVQFNVLVIKQ